MSLTVSPQDIELAQAGQVDDETFAGIIRTSLPYAFEAVQRLADRLRSGEQVAFERPPHLEDTQRNQLLRVFASTSMREFLERHFGIGELAFQNCHFIGGATDAGLTSPEWQRFRSIEGQILAQSPELVDC